MHVAELMNLLLAVAVGNECQFRDQDHRLVHGRTAVEALGGTVAQIRHQGRPHLVGDVDARKPQVADLLTGQTVVFVLEFPAAFPDDVAHARQRVGRARDGDDMLPRQFDLVAGAGGQKGAWQPATVEPRDGFEQPLDRFDRRLRQIDGGRFHLHHPPPGDVDRQRRDVVEVGVGNEPGARGHEAPRLASQIEAQLELRNPPVALDGRPGIALHGEPFVDKATKRRVFDHSISLAFSG